MENWSTVSQVVVLMCVNILAYTWAGLITSAGGMIERFHFLAVPIDYLRTKQFLPGSKGMGGGRKGAGEGGRNDPNIVCTYE
jgi:hypothetical protein